MRKILLLLLLLPMVCHAYEDHRGRNLDSLERSISQWTPPALARAAREEKIAYCMTCRELMWGYLQLDGNKARLWGTLGNFYEAQDYIGLMLH